MAATPNLAFARDAARPSLRPVCVWLVAMAALVLAMVLVGGATRLTESGLSITEWKPVTGVLPPLSPAEWQAEFERYKQIPQYSALNADMTLDGFKVIYGWEWAHRLLARIVGAAFILPALWFWASGRLKGRLGRAVFVSAGFLALEPLVGWWMVRSGLSVRTEVAQERLAIHLLIAAAVFGTLIWAAVGLARRREAAARGFVVAAALFAALLYVQLGLGALVAGLRAGSIYNTWPLMGDRFLPGEAFGGWRALFEDAATVQFLHRLAAYGVIAYALAQAVAARRAGLAGVRRRTAVLASFALLQAGFGVATLLTGVALGLALAHQALAFLLFGAAVAHWRMTYG